MEDINKKEKKKESKAVGVFKILVVVTDDQGLKEDRKRYVYAVIIKQK